MRYAHTNIVSKDWKRLADFYIQVFRCELQPPERNQQGDWLSIGTGVPNAHLKGAHLLLPGHGPGGPTLEIYEYRDILDSNTAAPNRKGIGHLAFEVEDVRKVAKTLVNKGGSLYGEISEQPIKGLGVLTFVYAQDPDGNLIELQNWSRKD